MTTPRKKTGPKIHAAEAVWLDPLNCDSTIAYKVVTRSRGPWASIKLSDCEHKIEWYCKADKEGLAKLDRAIAALHTCRAILASVQPSPKRPARKAKA
jgi:hypothetical protein